MSLKRSKSILISAIFFILFGGFAVAFGLFLMFSSSYIGSTWTNKFPILDVCLIIVGVAFISAAFFLGRMKSLGAYIGIISYVIAFTINIYVGTNFYVHVVVGGSLGLFLFVPLLLGWKSLS